MLSQFFSCLMLSDFIFFGVFLSFTELEKPKQQDSAPEWAKASLQRRQRLLGEIL